ncbi:hypothetical protein LTR56_026453 [Elasticomyces elasticus]|nr:hypothetical protein LTR56_026453 [Elasticomyces elasticus]KAK4903725.1 hypothetical protein LTR49_026691 [Elasticomyces elasticus]KAK5735692.1 hypothetical protein LTS12_026407 [Elasticomyces elasticus]
MSQTRHTGASAATSEFMEALEEQASSCRQLAFQRLNINLDVYGVLQHALLPQQMSQPSNLNQLAFGAPLGLPYQFDPSTTFRPDDTLKTGYMPTGGEAQDVDAN